MESLVGKSSAQIPHSISCRSHGMVFAPTFTGEDYTHQIVRWKVIGYDQKIEIR
jgi:hypothetical protein